MRDSPPRFPDSPALPLRLADDDDDSLAEFLEAEVLSFDSDSTSTECNNEDETEERPPKKPCSDKAHGNMPSIESGDFSKIPLELFHNILKFLSSEDLVTCATVCQFLRTVASDESLWRRLYCLRWGLPSSVGQSTRPRGSAWKQLYFERDRADMVEFVRNTPTEFREYYIQMQAAKRSQAPLPSQVKDDLIIVDTTVAEQISSWRRSHELPDVYPGNHSCSGKTCAYFQIGDVFLCEKTGRAHVCDDTCREIVLDPSNDLLVCTISGRCFDRWLSPAEEEAVSGNQLDSNGMPEEVEEPFMGSGRFARAYSLGYNCEDEKELEAALRCCSRPTEVVYPGSNKWKTYKIKSFCYENGNSSY